MFSINEEIDFSDDDLDLSILNLPANKGVEPGIVSSSKHKNDSSIKRTQTETNVSPKCNILTTPKPTKRFKFTKTENKNSNIDTEAHKETNCIDLPDNFFDIDDEDDDLFSLLDFPKNDKNKSTVGTVTNRTMSTTTPIAKNLKLSKYEKDCSIDSSVNTKCANDNILYNRNTVARKCPEQNTQNIMSTLSPDNISTVKQSSKQVICQKRASTPVSKNIFQLRSAGRDQESPKAGGETPVRKFPGPAGNLPKLSNLNELDSLRSPPFSKSKKLARTPITPKTPQQDMAPSHDQTLYTQLWTAMHDYVNSNFSMDSLLSFSEIFDKSSKRELENCKVPLLCGVVKSFSIVGNSGRLVLEDDTGEMNGAVHHDVLDEYQQGLGKGSGLILKDVSVFSPSIKKHYLNITPANIAAMFERDLEEPLTQFTQVGNNSTIILDTGT